MKITKQILDIIEKATENCRAEIGGILGSSDNNVINNIVIDDAPIETPRACVYYPNIEFLNCKIAEWQKEDISFMGMFHTHFAGVKTLSNGDIKYIKVIMKAMPDFIEYLYFPLYVLPNKELVCYRATKIIDSVEIFKDKVQIL